jgi:hypothetical protein
MQAEAAGAANRLSIVAALQNAAAATGSDFHYLLGTAIRESSLQPQARSSTSSAAGLFQFTEQTWLGLVKEHGAKYGLGSMARTITKDACGHYHADNAGDRQAILALRNDPRVSALMAGEYAKTTRAVLQSTLGRGICGGELYAAHFLGADAACKLIRLSETRPDADAAAVFPKAAGANKSVFYHPNGSAKSVREVYDWALKQPGGEGTARLAATGPMPDTQILSDYITAKGAGRADIATLLAGVMNWQPKHGYFGQSIGNDPNGASGTGPLMLSPAILELLAGTKSDPAA